MKSFVAGAFAALSIAVGAHSAAAASLDISTGLPTIGASQAELNYSVVGGVDGDVSVFDAAVDSVDGVVLSQPAYVQLSVSYNLADPLGAPTGGFSVFDEFFEPVLSGDLVQMGYRDDTIELLFGTLQDSLASSFSSQVLMTIVFDEPLNPAAGTNPLTALSDLGVYDVSVTIANVVAPIPVPAGLPLMLTSAAAFAWARRRQHS